MALSAYGFVSLFCRTLLEPGERFPGSKTIKTMETKDTIPQEEEILVKMKLPERIDIRVDWAFKWIFSKEKHLVKIIKDLLDLDIEVIEYLPNELAVGSEEEKRSRFDVICKNTQTGEIFVLEMQTTYEYDMPDRLYYYAGSLIHNQVKVGDKSYTVNSVLICCIAGYHVHHRESVPEGKVFFRYKMKDEETGEVFDGDKLNICFLELNRFCNYLDKYSDLKAQWCWIFNNLSIFVHRPENLDSSFNDLLEDSCTKKLKPMEKEEYLKAAELTDFDRENIYKGGVYMGRLEGFDEGRQEGKQEIARAMLAKGFEVSDISELTGLTAAEIASISKG